MVGGWPALLCMLVVQEGGLWLVERVSGAAERSWASGLFLGAFALRAAVALPMHYVLSLSNGNGALFPDDFTNDVVAEWLVRIGRGEGLSIFPGHQHLLDSSYTYLVSGVYAVFGYAPLLPKLVNCALGGFNAFLIFEIARRSFGARAAALAGLGAAVIPTLILWSLLTLKETMVLLVALIGLWALQSLAQRTSATRAADGLVLFIIAMVASIDLRLTTTVILLPLGLLVVARQIRGSALAWLFAGITATLITAMGVGFFALRSETTGRPPDTIVEDVLLQIRHRRAQEAANARSQIRPQVEVVAPDGHSGLPDAEAASDQAPFSFSADVLDPLGYALLAPAPWQVRSLTELALSAEMLAWYAFLGGAFFALRAGPSDRTFVACLIVFGVANWLALAASEGNLGNLVRHRLMLAPSLLILGGAGLHWLWIRTGRPILARSPIGGLRLEARRGL